MDETQARDLAMALFTGQLKDMSYLSPDPEIQNSVMFQPVPDMTSGYAESTIPLLADLTPLGDADAFIQGAQDRSPLAMALAALSFGLPGTIRPIAKASNYLPDAVKLAKRRVVEPIVGVADDAATVEISDLAREMAVNAEPPVWYHGTGTNIEDMPGQSFRLSAPEQSSVPVVMGTNNWVTAEEFAPGSMDIGADLGFKYALEGGKPGGVYALKSTVENPLIHDAAGKKWFDVPMDKILREAKESGREAVIFKNIIDSKWNQTPSDVIAWLNPARIRAVTAAMDPAKRESENIFAGVAPLLAPTALAAALSQFGTEDQ